MLDLFFDNNHPRGFSAPVMNAKPRIADPLLDDAAPDEVSVEMQGPGYTPLRPRRMSLMTHTLARAAKTGFGLSLIRERAGLPHHDIFMDEAPNDADLIETLKKDVV